MKNVILIRGVSGAGKTTIANILSNNKGTICCADDYFTDDEGNYNFDASKLALAHTECQQKFLRLLNDHEESLIIVANTSTKDSDFNFYIEEAKKRNIAIFSLVLENRHGNKNIHNVPEHVLERQKENIKNSLKL